MKENFKSDEKGVSAIEAAILLPVLILLVMAVIEFGMYFVKYQIATRAVSNISDTIQKDPTKATYSLATQQGLSILNLTNLPNYICAKSYVDEASATSGLCASGIWDVSAPAGLAANTSYYVAIRAYAPHTSITPFTTLSKSFPPPIDVKAVVLVNKSQPQLAQKVCTISYTSDSIHLVNLNVPSSWTNQNCYNYMVYMKDRGYAAGHSWAYSLQCVFSDGVVSRSTSVQSYDLGSYTYSPNPTFIPSPNCGW